ARVGSGGALWIAASRSAGSALALVSMCSIRHWNTSSNSPICSSEKSTAPLMNRSVTRRRVSTRCATVPCASVVCSSSSRLSDVAADFELMTLLYPGAWGGDGFFVPGNGSVGSGAGDAVASSCLGCVERAVGARENRVGRLIRVQRRDAGGNRHPHAGREGAPVEIGDDGPQ